MEEEFLKIFVRAQRKFGFVCSIITAFFGLISKWNPIYIKRNILRRYYVYSNILQALRYFQLELKSYRFFPDRNYISFTSFDPHGRFQ